MREIRFFAAGLFILAVVGAAYFARDFLLPVVVAFFIALTFRPGIRMLAKRGIPAWLATSVIMAAIVASVIAGSYLIAVPVSTWVAEAPSYAQTFARKLSEIRSSFDALIHLTEKLEEATTAGQTNMAEVVVRQPGSSYLLPITGYSAGIVTTIVLTLVIAAFLMASGDMFYEKLVKVLPTLSDKKRALRIVYDVENEVSVYILTITAINAGLGAAVGFSFFLLGMPSPALWGILVFALNFIPYIGAITGIGLSAFMAVITFDTLGYAALVPLTYAAWNGIENQFVTPLFLGKRLALNSVAILLALTFWTWLWGFPGAMVAVPILITVKTFCGHIEALSGLGEFLAGSHNGSLPATEEARQ